MIAALAAALALGVLPPIATTTRDGADPVRVVVVSANIHGPMHPPAARADLNLATRNADVVLAQEMRRRDAADYLRAGWHVWQPTRPRCREVPIYWGPAWRRVDAHAVILRHWTGAPHGTRCASRVVLRHRTTGRLLVAVDVHMIPHVEIRGHPRDLGRVAIYAEGMARLDRLLDQLRDRYRYVVVGGDWNVDYVADRRVRWGGFPYAYLHRAWDTHWAKLPPARPTLYRRRIDSIWWVERPRHVRPLDSWTIGRTNSDHEFPALRLRLR